MCPVYQGVLIKGLHCTINRAFCLMYMYICLYKIIQTGYLGQPNMSVFSVCPEEVASLYVS